MNHSSDHDEKLTRLIGDTLRGQPQRRAPDTLEQRVLGEIELRATTPWWRMHFARWPWPAQAGFLMISAVLAKVAIDVSLWLMNSLDSTHLVSAVTSAAMSLKLLAGIAAAIVNSIPPLWIYGSIAAIAAMYVALFGISAAAYRTLYAGRPSMPVAK